jgi:hypothetical protein
LKEKYFIFLFIGGYVAADLGRLISETVITHRSFSVEIFENEAHANCQNSEKQKILTAIDIALKIVKPSSLRGNVTPVPKVRLPRVVIQLYNLHSLSVRI